MLERLLVALAACSVGVALAACAANGQPDPPPPSQGDPASGATPNEGLGPDGGGSVGDATTAVDGAAPTGDGAASPEEAAVDAAPDAPLDAQVGCNGQGVYCPVPSQVCCGVYTPFSQTYSCTAPQACVGSSAVPIPCDDATDCAAMGAPGTVCCADTRTTTLKVGCVPPTACGTTNNQTILCDPYDFSSCPTGKRCKASSNPVPNVFVCTDQT